MSGQILVYESVQALDVREEAVHAVLHCGHSEIVATAPSGYVAASPGLQLPCTTCAELARHYLDTRQRSIERLIEEGRRRP